MPLHPESLPWQKGYAGLVCQRMLNVGFSRASSSLPRGFGGNVSGVSVIESRCVCLTALSQIILMEVLITAQVDVCGRDICWISLLTSFQERLY